MKATRTSSRINSGKLPAKYADSYIFSAVITEPASYNEALASPQAELWIKAMDEEYASLMENNTWTLVETPAHIKPIPVKWVYKIKRDPAGNIERFKARLVAKGFKQIEGIDFNEVFAPTSRYSTYRALISKAAAENLEIHHIDIKTAFLQGELEEEVYTMQPPGYHDGTSRTSCYLHKALYGLKQAPRAWHLKLHSKLISMDYRQSEADPSLYIYDQSSRQPTWLLAYVDDIKAFGADSAFITKTKQQLLAEFDGRDLGQDSPFLGISTERDRSSGTIKLSNWRMITDLVSKFGLSGSNGRSLPISTGLDLTSTSAEPLDTSKFPYRQLVGSLMHLAVTIRPDISYSVGVLSRHLSNPSMIHWITAKGVLRYLSSTADYGITYSKKTPGFLGYCDSDYAGDTISRHSTTGYVFVLNGGAITWASKKQSTVAASTTEAEYIAAGAAVKEGLWLRKLTQDLHIDIGQVQIMGDNQSALKLLRNPVSSVRTKHIDIVHHFARERVLRNEVGFTYISTDQQVADVLTKALPAAKHQFCCKGMGVF
jgi:hypothetical protein